MTASRPSRAGGRRSSYDSKFFESIRSGVRRSAETVVPHLLRQFPSVRRVVDIGCGEGWWGREFERAGCEVLGVEAHAEPEIPSITADLRDPLPDLGQFDLALCLEVAEHLPFSRARGLVDDLCGLASIIVFSAAVPGQGGNGHLNERWPDYWERHFAGVGYRGSGALRWVLWEDPRVEWWYRQNLLVFARDLDLPPGCPSVVHPEMWQHHGH